MTDYISREAAIKAVGDYEKVKIAKGLVTPEKAVVVLAGLPAADVVEVVRCKDCKHLYEDNGCPLRTWWTHLENDFCSYGERREDE